MMRSNGNNSFRIEKRSIVAIVAGVLIGLGICLQFAQIVLSRIIAQDAWFFITVFQASRSILNASSSAAPWLDAVRDLPLLLVVVGASLLFSICRCARGSAELTTAPPELK